MLFYIYIYIYILTKLAYNIWLRFMKQNLRLLMVMIIVIAEMQLLRFI